MISHIDIGYNGRLGNQLFNYALLLALRKNNRNVCVPEKNCIKVKDDGCFDAYHKYWIKYRCVLYDYFNLTIPKETDEVIRDIKNVVVEKSFNYDPAILSISDNTLLMGYFQSYKYFNELKDVIKLEFTFKNEIKESAISKYNINFENSLAIHIRLGDTLGQPWVYKLNSDYILNAISMFESESIQYMAVFSDNIEYCKNWFNDDANIIYIDGVNESESLYLMTQCKHFIMSPSTYSWWGAYLGEKHSSKIVFPSSWFSDGRNLNDLLLPNWLIL